MRLDGALGDVELLCNPRFSVTTGHGTRHLDFAFGQQRQVDGDRVRRQAPLQQSARGKQALHQFGPDPEPAQADHLRHPRSKAGTASRWQ